MKKIIRKILALTLTVTATFSLVACGGGENNNVGENEEGSTIVHVKAYDAGYGHDWLISAKDKFNALYKSKGYEIQIVDVDPTIDGLVAESEIKDFGVNSKEKGIDIYFIGGVNIPEYIESSQSIRQLKGGILLEDLTKDVYKAKAIDFNGNEENVTIEEKLEESARKYYQYSDDSNTSYESLVGNYYSFPWASGASGLYVNKKALTEKGLSVPVTTDELLEQFGQLKPNQVTNDFYPLTFPGGDAMGYMLYLFDTLFAQYSGVKAENDLWNLSKESDGYKVYEDNGLLKALETIQKITSKEYVKQGSNQFTIDRSQGELIKGNALYMVSGNWIYNEMKSSSPDKVDDIEMIKAPIISSLGEKLSISETTLRNVVKDIDLDKQDVDIISANGVTAEVVKAIRDARNVYFNASVDHQALIPSYSPSKKVAKEFLRFLASDDFMDEYRKTTNSSLPFNYATTSNVTLSNFEKSVIAVSGRKDAVMLTENIYTSSVRRAGIHLFGKESYASVFEKLAYKDLTANEVYTSTKNWIKQNYSNYIK